MNAKPGDRVTITCDIYGTFEAVATAVEAPDASGTYKLTCQRLRDEPALSWPYLLPGHVEC